MIPETCVCYFPDNCDSLQFVQSMEIDPASGYMWIIDGGRREWLTPDPINACPGKIVILDLNTDQVGKTLPPTGHSQTAFLWNEFSR